MPAFTRLQLRQASAGPFGKRHARRIGMAIRPVAEAAAVHRGVRLELRRRWHVLRSGTASRSRFFCRPQHRNLAGPIERAVGTGQICKLSAEFSGYCFIPCKHPTLRQQQAKGCGTRHPSYARYAGWGRRRFHAYPRLAPGATILCPLCGLKSSGHPPAELPHVSQKQANVWHHCIKKQILRCAQDDTFIVFRMTARNNGSVGVHRQFKKLPHVSPVTPTSGARRGPQWANVGHHCTKKQVLRFAQDFGRRPRHPRKPESWLSGDPSQTPPQRLN